MRGFVNFYPIIIVILVSTFGVALYFTLMPFLTDNRVQDLKPITSEEEASKTAINNVASKANGTKREQNKESAFPIPPTKEDFVKEAAVQTPAAPTEEENVSAPAPPQVQETAQTTLSFTDINTQTREAVVNILCTTKSAGPFSPISGSGVVIDDRGVILTNAHIAQYFLLQNYLVENFTSCVIRTGSPARAHYKAEILHISPQWIEDNAEQIIVENPKGTGENDFALLLITEHIEENKQLPDSFPFVKTTTNDSSIEKNINVLLAGYAAGFLGGITIQKDLYLTSTITQIMEIFTFKEGVLDIFSIGGSIVAQSGSSGGAVVNDKNELIGIIVTSSQAETTQERDLRAITLSHINRSLIKYSNTTLSELLSGNLVSKKNIFNTNTISQLTTYLTDVLDR